MNTTNEEIFQYCGLLKSRYQLFSKIPSKAIFTSMISACTVITILIIPTILLNGVSVVTIMKCPQLKEKIAYFLIMVQSLADLAVGFISLPFMSYVCITDAFGIGDCFRHLVIVNVIMIPTLISLITLTAMTVERYMSIIHPIKHRNLVTKGGLIVFLVCGILFITVCNALSVLQSQLLGSFLGIYMLLFLLLATFVYTKIYFALQNLKRPGSVGDNATRNSQNERKLVKKIKLVKSCFLAVACFFLCFSAAIIILLLESYVDSPDFSWLRMCAGAIVMLNSSLNSVIFFWTRPLLRNEAFKVLKKMCISITW
jgi:hypothetical protein